MENETMGVIQQRTENKQSMCDVMGTMENGLQKEKVLRTV
jgi:hypothetical protein